MESASDLLALTTNSGQGRSATVESQFALVYWIDEARTSVVPLKNIVNEEHRKAEVTTGVRWSKKCYTARILRIGDDKVALEAEQDKLIEEMRKVSSGHATEDECDPVEASAVNSDTPQPTAKQITRGSTMKIQRPPKQPVHSVTPRQLVAPKETVAMHNSGKSKASQKSKQLEAGILRQEKRQQQLAKLRQEEVQFENMIGSSSAVCITCEELTEKVHCLEQKRCKEKEMVSALNEELEDFRKENIGIKADLTEMREENKELRAELDRKEVSKPENSSSTKFSVAITPTKVQLFKEMTALLERQSSVKRKLAAPSPSQPSPKRSHEEDLPRFPVMDLSDEPTPSKEKLHNAGRKKSLQSTLQFTPTHSPSTSKPVTTPLDSPKPVSTKPSKVELYPGTGVYIGSHQKTSVLASTNGKPDRVVRKLLEILFPLETLAHSNALGSRKAANNTSEETFEALDVNILTAIRKYVFEEFKRPDGTPLLREKDFNYVVNSKCGTARRTWKALLAEEQKEEK